MHIPSIPQGAWLSLLVVIAGIVVASTAEISHLGHFRMWEARFQGGVTRITDLFTMKFEGLV